MWGCFKLRERGRVRKGRGGFLSLERERESEKGAWGFFRFREIKRVRKGCGLEI